jgi:hypothetical protein
LLTHERGKPINVCKLYNEARDMRETPKADLRAAPNETSFEHGMSRKPAKTRSPSNRPRLTEDKAFRSMRQQILKSFFREHRDSYKFWFDWDTAQRTVKVRIRGLDPEVCSRRASRKLKIDAGSFFCLPISAETPRFLHDSVPVFFSLQTPGAGKTRERGIPRSSLGDLRGPSSSPSRKAVLQPLEATTSR